MRNHLLLSKLFLYCTSLAFGLYSFGVASFTVNEVVSQEAAKPNILYFYVDDMGWGSIGPNGQAVRREQNLPYVRTPHIDRLARQGVNFTRGYGCHVCSPARSSQQTGFHQGHTFADRNDPNNAKKAIRKDDITMGEALADAGYVTGYWGKWGYGGSKDQQAPVIENVQTLPTSHGYQHVLAELHHVRAHTFFQPTLWQAPASPDAVGGLELVTNSMAKYQNNDDYPNAPAMQNHPDYPGTAYCDDMYAFAALDFVRTQGQHYNETGQPFLGVLAVQIPHAPFAEIATLPNWDGDYKDDEQFAELADQTRQWAAMVSRIDAHFGNILAALEDPNNDGDTSDSIADNTLVIFQSDNGGPGGASRNQLDANGGLSGTKGKIQEGGIRVPLVMRWPSRINADSRLKAGTDCDRVVDVTDLLPTFCELAGVAAPLGVDGVSIAPLLSGEGTQRHREFIIHEAGNGQSIIRGKDKLIRARNGSVKLYDLDADPAESEDVAAEFPELTRELEQLLLGERVTEPRGFATTYHEWAGTSGQSLGDSANWSDYQYANAGVTYMKDDGAPQSAWIASIRYDGAKPRKTLANEDLELLALAIQGETKEGRQSLTVEKDVELHGRNEIRLESFSHLELQGGCLSSLRWVDVFADASLTGYGRVDASIYNEGVISVQGEDQSQLDVTRDFHQDQQGVLSLAISESSPAALQVSGQATLDGELKIQFAEGITSESGQSFTLIQCKNRTGKFSNENDEVVTADGTRFGIGYSDTQVTVTRK